MNTVENNKLIAEFMGHHYDENRNSHNDSEYFYEDSELEYDFNWNWLMEVVERIETVYDGEITFEIEGANVKIYNLDRSFHKYITMETKIEAVYNAVVEFINFYNSAKKQN